MVAPKNEAFEVVRRQGTEETGWKKERLLAIKLLHVGELVITEIAKLLGSHCNRINDWTKLFRDRWRPRFSHQIVTIDR